MTQSQNRDVSPAWIAAAALIGAVSVVAGAFAAHGFDPTTEARQIGWLHTGSLYAALHALAMLATVALTRIAALSSRFSVFALWLFLAGSIIFPGALYGLALGGPLWLGAIAPAGGTAFILGWAALAASALKRS